MRKYVTTVLLFFLVLFVVGCSQSKNTEVIEIGMPEVDGKQIMETASAELQRLEIPYKSLYVFKDKNPPILRIQIADDLITYFGLHVYNIMENRNTIAPDIDLDISVDSGGKNALVFSFSGSDDLYGTLFDKRSGTTTLTDLSTVDDLAEIFPAMKTTLNLNDVDPDDVNMYNEIMDILNSDFSRSEDEILTELAPEYGMTYEELKEFMMNMLLQSHGF